MWRQLGTNRYKEHCHHISHNTVNHQEISSSATDITRKQKKPVTFSSAKARKTLYVGALLSVYAGRKLNYNQKYVTEKVWLPCE